MWSAVVMLCAAVVSIEAAGGKPPEIIVPQGNKWKVPTFYVRRLDTYTYDCQAAETSGKNEYLWQMNGTDFVSDTNTVSFNKDTGRLSIGPFFNVPHSGDYQCIVKNQFGTAMTPYLTLLATRAETFPGADNAFPEDVTEYVTNYKMLRCKDVPISVPPWKFSWEKGIKVNNVLETYPVSESDRIIIDRYGNLHFIWIEMSDNNHIYSCSGYNDVILITVKNTHTMRLTVKPAESTDLSRPLKLLEHEDVTVKAGDNAVLSCIFTYYSQMEEKIEITWLFKNKKVGTGHKLILENVQVPTATHSKEGPYICEGRLGKNEPQRGTVNLRIVAPPDFVPNRSPQSRAFPVEKDAKFFCESTSHNSYSRPPVWLVNSEPLVGCPPHNFECREKRRENGYSQCIHKSMVCNGNPECSDDSDEENCPITCGEGYMDCRGKCVPSSDPCEDLRCAYPGFKCYDASHCLTKEQVCDGKNDCKDGSDEKACPNRESLNVNRYVINSARTELTLPKVTLSDSMCFQCLVENDYGKVFGDGCITVIDKIVVTVRPNDTYYTEPDSFINVGVDAYTDKAYENDMNYQWFWFRPVVDPDTGDTYIKKQGVMDDPILRHYFHLTLKEKNLTITIPEVKAEDEDTTAFDTYTLLTEDRVFQINISHPFDQVILNFTVSGKKIEKPVVKPVVKAASFNLWFIALILGILFLFIVVALIICYMHRNRGGTYLLDKKEQQAGHDPEQELKDSGFHDVGRVGDDDFDNPDAEKVSLTESVKPYESDEDITEEYGGDFDVSKFNEDGSFIGLYGDKKSKYSDSKEATV